MGGGLSTNWKYDEKKEPIPVKFTNMFRGGGGDFEVTLTRHNFEISRSPTDENTEDTPS